MRDTRSHPIVISVFGNFGHPIVLLNIILPIHYSKVFFRTMAHSLVFTFFYINRRKYWFRANFRFPVFDGFTPFRMS